MLFTLRVASVPFSGVRPDPGGLELHLTTPHFHSIVAKLLLNLISRGTLSFGIMAIVRLHARPLCTTGYYGLAGSATLRSGMLNNE
jgi:hypothetical protein